MMFLASSAADNEHFESSLNNFTECTLSHFKCFIPDGPDHSIVWNNSPIVSFPLF